MLSRTEGESNMIKLESLQELLNIEQENLKKLDTEKLRLLIGSLRYSVRQCERELNSRFADNPLGISTE